MSLLEHLEELRRRIIHSVVYLVVGFFVAWAFMSRSIASCRRRSPSRSMKHGLPPQLIIHNPIDGFNMYLKISFMGGCIIAAPFVLYQVWLFISPGLYQNEKRYVMPFMIATVGLFLAGAFFGYRWVFPGSLDFLFTFSHEFQPAHRGQRIHRSLPHSDPRPGHDV